MTKLITLPSGDYVFYMPKSTELGYTLSIMDGVWHVSYEYGQEHFYAPTGVTDRYDCKFLGLAGALSEEICREIVDYETYPTTDDIMYYIDYLNMSFSTCDTAVESLRTLVKYHGFDPANCFVIKVSNI